jgi:hypothetical protein
LNEESNSKFGHASQHSDYLKGTERAKNILAGSCKFETVEIEVYFKTK